MSDLYHLPNSLYERVEFLFANIDGSWPPKSMDAVVELINSLTSVSAAERTESQQALSQLLTEHSVSEDWLLFNEGDFRSESFMEEAFTLSSEKKALYSLITNLLGIAHYLYEKSLLLPAETQATWLYCKLIEHEMLLTNIFKSEPSLTKLIPLIVKFMKTEVARVALRLDKLDELRSIYHMEYNRNVSCTVLD